MGETLQTLLAGNERHAAGDQSRFDDCQTGQSPAAVTVCCSDSRVLQDHMWDNDEPGKVFTCANIGNRVGQETGDGLVVSGDVLYPIEHTGTETVVVVGHTGCGAVTAAYDALADGRDEPPGIQHCIDAVAAGIEPALADLPEDVDRTTAVNRLVEANVDRQVDVVLESPDVPETVEVVGAVYDFQDVYGGRRGEIHVTNVDGIGSVERLRAAYPEFAGRIDRCWPR